MYLEDNYYINTRRIIYVCLVVRGEVLKLSHEGRIM